ncbi:plasmalemma vesicle associated protein b [Gouania willdenowi]|uniref:Plasmalemma vesicle associated protein b n=1 Tax=Gouania willdenowi TaxID=441366 RepID=A0A8C5HSQ1_GOUWI|nr:plasmalemma vesicle-associated protein [Gouania willdenowi]
MYSSSYSRAKFGMEARVPLHQSKGKSCGYYMRIIFFFSSLIQSLIIVSLVLFLIYGQPEKSAEEMRVKELEQGYNRLSANNIQLRKEKGQLGAQLGARTAEKGVLEKEVALLKVEANHTEHLQRSKLMMCENAKAALAMMARRSSTPVQHVPVVSTSSELKTLQSLNVQQKAMITLINSNFTQTVHYLMVERDSALKERDETTKEVIALRRQNTLLEEQFTSYTRKCKEDFAHSLDGIHLVTTNFLSRINNLFPPQLTFHLTCDSQREQMEKIRNSCTNLSRDVENKFQLYLDNVGIKVANIQAQSSRLEVLNTRLTSDMQQCESRRREEATQAAQQLELKQRNHDDKVEKLLMEQDRLRNQKKLHEESLMQERKNNQDLQTMLTNARASIPKPAAMPGAPQQGR